MNTPKFIRSISAKRTLQNMKEDLEKYEQYEQNPKMAKYCNNVIADTFFNIPLEQVRQFFCSTFVSTTNQILHLQFAN